MLISGSLLAMITNDSNKEVVPNLSESPCSASSASQASMPLMHVHHGSGSPSSSSSHAAGCENSLQ